MEICYSWRYTHTHTVYTGGMYTHTKAFTHIHTHYTYIHIYFIFHVYILPYNLRELVRSLSRSWGSSSSSSSRK